jgi:hypothetical protein
MPIRAPAELWSESEQGDDRWLLGWDWSAAEVALHSRFISIPKGRSDDRARRLASIRAVSTDILDFLALDISGGQSRDE